MNRITSFKLAPKDQSSSPLFSILPGEIRDEIFREALSSYQDTSRAYDMDTSYRRPNYLAPFKCDCALLQTCQQIYSEAWFHPWTTAVHTFWLAWPGRRPEIAGARAQEHSLTLTLQNINKWKENLQKLYDNHGEVELSHVRVFSQLCELNRLPSILNTPHFHPRFFTITIRHHDWWFWERDAPLYIDQDPCRSNVRYPSSLQEVHMELESLKRRKDQIDFIADQMAQGWWMQRDDGVVMTAEAKDFEVDTWSGSSTWEGHRWIRDETQPGVNEYYIKTVVWKPNRAMKEKDRPAWPQKISVPMLQPVVVDPLLRTPFRPPSLSVNALNEAGVGEGVSAEEAWKMVTEWRQRSRGAQTPGRGRGRLRFPQLFD